MNFHHQNRARNPLFKDTEKKQPLMNDPSDQADDHWFPDPSSPAQPEPEETEQLPEWQRTGYHMEALPCDEAVPMDATNDEPVELPENAAPVPYDLDVDPFDPEAEGLSPTQSQALPPQISEAPSTADEAPEESIPQTQTASGPLPPVRTIPSAHPILKLFGLVVCVGLLVFGIVFYIFRIDEINIVGNEYYTAEQIISMTGIHTGEIFLPTDEEKVRSVLEKNRYLYVVRMERGDHSITIQIHERTPVAYTIWHGIYYTLDSRGMVLEEYATDSGLTSLVLVDKLQITSCLPGEHIVMQDSDTLTAYIQLMLEFKAMSLFEDVASLNLDDLENLSLYTRDGYFVRLGDTTYLHGKLRSMSLVLTELRGSDAYTPGGTIDVSTREYPTYSPPDSGS